MPIYEYECNKCHEIMEIVQGITEKAKRKCPACGGRIKRLISLNAFHLKGGGWYKEGYGSSSANSGDNGNGKGKGKAKETSSGETKKTEGKKEKKESKDSKKKKGSAAVT